MAAFPGVCCSVCNSYYFVAYFRHPNNMRRSLVRSPFRNRYPNRTNEPKVSFKTDCNTGFDPREPTRSSYGVGSHWKPVTDKKDLPKHFKVYRAIQILVRFVDRPNQPPEILLINLDIHSASDMPNRSPPAFPQQMSCNFPHTDPSRSPVYQYTIISAPSVHGFSVSF
jgi:hypothetical protein